MRWCLHAAELSRGAQSAPRLWLFVWSDLGSASPRGCFLPLWRTLDELVEQHPSAAAVLYACSMMELMTSIHKWAGGSLARRWVRCRSAPALPKALERQAAAPSAPGLAFATSAHLTITCVEFDVKSEAAGSALEASFGALASCWVSCDPRAMRCKQAS